MRMFLPACVAAIALSACTFEPYDYDTHEDARLRAKHSNTQLRLHGKQLKLEKTIPLPVGKP